MNRVELRARQAPLRDRYTEDPAAASTVVSASADWRDSGITTTVQTWAGPVRAGLHPATGGDGNDACSADMLLQALLACVGVTLRSVATAMNIEIRHARLSGEAMFDARGTLGMDRSVPVGLGQAEVRIRIDSDVDDATLSRLAASTERYCVIGQSLREPPLITIGRFDEHEVDIAS